jgi:hypothetical protein
MALGEHFVHRDTACKCSTARVGHTVRVEYALYRTILAVRPMQRIERNVELVERTTLVDR